MCQDHDQFVCRSLASLLSGLVGNSLDKLRTMKGDTDPVRHRLEEGKVVAFKVLLPI
jgi:hypothetical protein